MKKTYVYFVSFSYPSVESINFTNNLVGIPVFGNCEVALEEKINSIDDLRSIRDKLKKDFEFKDLVILNFQLLREERGKKMINKLRCCLWRTVNGYLEVWDYESDELINEGELMLVALDEGSESIRRLFDYYYKQHGIDKAQVQKQGIEE